VLVSAGTIEEDILDRARQKRDLDAKVIQAGMFNDRRRALKCLYLSLSFSFFLFFFSALGQRTALSSAAWVPPASRLARGGWAARRARAVACTGSQPCLHPLVCQ